MNRQDDIIPNFANKAGHISDSKIFQFLNTDNKKVRNDSVVNSIAQSNILCDDNSEQKETSFRKDKHASTIYEKNKELGMIVEIMINGAARVSEVLEIKCADIKSTGHLIIRGKKGSEDRIITTTLSDSYLRKCKLHSFDPFSHLNRWYIYREFKKLGIEHKFQGKTKNSVTHYYRQMTLRLFHVEQEKINTRAKLSGHKNKKSLKYYE